MEPLLLELLRLRVCLIRALLNSIESIFQRRSLVLSEVVGFQLKSLKILCFTIITMALETWMHGDNIIERPRLPIVIC